MEPDYNATGDGFNQTRGSSDPRNNEMVQAISEKYEKL